MSIKGKAVQLSQAVEGFLSLGNKNAAPTFYGLIADLEARAGRTDSALASIERALGVAQQNGEHWTDLALLRRKGKILFQRDPHPGAAEEAFRAAIGVANRQDARSLRLQAALALAKLYKSNANAAEAQAVLQPALEGFWPTPDVPEIAEARALLEGLAMTR